MKKSLSLLSALALFVFISGCASGVKQMNQTYRYGGETYGKMSVTLSDKVTEDVRKSVRAEQLDLASNLEHHLKANGLWDPESANEIQVTVNSLHVRNAFNAVMFGFMAGRDHLAGTVKLVTAGVETNEFEITASWALGGMAGGQDASRLGWLSGKFAELTAETILGRKAE